MGELHALQPLRGNFNQFPGRLHEHRLARLKGKEGAAAPLFESIGLRAVQADLPVEKRLLGKLVQVLPQQHPNGPRQVGPLLHLGRGDPALGEVEH